MNKVFNGYHAEVPIYVFDIQDVPTMPPGLYYAVGIDFEALEPGEASLFDVPLRGPFLSQQDAIEFAKGYVEDVRKDMDLLEGEFSFVDEEDHDCAA
jgi:hypothetical protein